MRRGSKAQPAVDPPFVDPDVARLRAAANLLLDAITPETIGKMTLAQIVSTYVTVQEKVREIEAKTYPSADQVSEIIQRYVHDSETLVQIAQELDRAYSAVRVG